MLPIANQCNTVLSTVVTVKKAVTMYLVLLCRMINCPPKLTGGYLHWWCGLRCQISWQWWCPKLKSVYWCPKKTHYLILLNRGIQMNLQYKFINRVKNFAAQENINRSWRLTFLNMVMSWQIQLTILNASVWELGSVGSNTPMLTIFLP